MRSGATNGRLALVVATVGALGCGRIEYTPRDGGSAELDASGIDASGIDASGIDASGIDANGVDAGREDDTAVAADVGRDTGPSCRASTTWIDGDGHDGLWRIAQGSGRVTFVQVQLSTITSVPGWPTGSGTLRLDDGVPGWFRPNLPRDLYFDGSDLWVATSTGLERLDPETGAVRGTLGPLTGGSDVMVASSGDGRVLAAVACTGGSGASWNGTAVACGDTDLAFFALDASGTVRGAHLGAGPGSDDLGDALWTGSDFLLSVAAQMSPFCVDGSVCEAVGGPTRTLALAAADGAPRGFLSALGSPFVALARDADGNVYGAGADLASMTPGGGSRRWLTDGPGFPRIGIDPTRPRVYFAGRLVRATEIGGVVVSPLGAESIAVVGLDRATGALVDQHVFGDRGPYSINGITVDDRGRITVLGDTATPFASCPSEAPPVFSSHAAFMLTIDP